MTEELTNSVIALEQHSSWILSTSRRWSKKDIEKLLFTVETLTAEDAVSASKSVTGISSPPTPDVLSCVSSNAGSLTSTVSRRVSQMVSSVPIVNGGSKCRLMEAENAVDGIYLNGRRPESADDWKIVLRALNREDALRRFQRQVLRPLIENAGWPAGIITDSEDGRAQMNSDILSVLHRVAKMKHFMESVAKSSSPGQEMDRFRDLETRRNMSTTRLKILYEKLVETKVVAQLNYAFSPRARSALIKFAQLAGKAKFTRSTKVWLREFSNFFWKTLGDWKMLSRSF